MECRMRTRVREMVEGLAREYQKELAAAGTFRDLEELTAEIGDEFGRQLCENELRDRARRAANGDWGGFQGQGSRDTIHNYCKV